MERNNGFVDVVTLDVCLSLSCLSQVQDNLSDLFITPSMHL